MKLKTAILEIEHGERVDIGSVNRLSTFLHQDSHFITNFLSCQKYKANLIFVLHVGYDSADHAYGGLLKDLITVWHK